MDQMLISDERLVMVVGGREKQSDGREMWEEHSDEKIRVERCCIKDIDGGTNIR